tara:strand:- start:106 stop:978 length:873 start_codon:yes stop_codon:yes gene_type:complete
MLLLRKIVIDISDFLGIIFPKIFLIKKNYKKSRLTIYNLHSTQENYFTDYKSILKKIDSQEKFLNPKNIDNFFEKKYIDQSYSLLTLDDGFYNNLEFAEKVLKPLKIKAIFFIIPCILKDKKNKNLKFFQVLYPNHDERLIYNLKDQFSPLSKENIVKIQKLGHSIGMHGFNHENFSELNEKQIKKLIKDGIDIFKKMNIPINHFAYPFGNKSSFNSRSNRILKKYFKYIHLGIRGSNYSDKLTNSCKLLNRHPLSTHKKDLIYFPISLKEIKFFTSNRISILLNIVSRK